MNFVSLSGLLVAQRSGYWGADPGTGDVDVRVVRNGDILDTGSIRWIATPHRGFRYNEADGAALKAGDILITTSGNCGYVAHVSETPVERTCASNFVRILRFDEERVLPRYLFHAMHRAEFRTSLQPFIRGTTLKNLSVTEAVSRPLIPVFPLSYQRRVVRLLDAADALRAKRRAALTQLDTLTQAIFNEMVGNGVDGTSRFPAVTLEDVASLLSGFAWKSDRFSKQPHGLPVIRIQNVDAVMDVEFVYWPDAYDKRFLVRRNDLLLTMSGSFRVALWVGPDALLNQRIARVDPKPGNDRCWLLYALRNALGSIEAMGRYALVNNVAMSDLRQLVLARPSLALQQSFARRVAAIEKLKAAHRDSLAEMDALFASLQHRAFQGEL